ncbi:MAG: AraC family ligand binding domain-containing protein [Proteobacteria bacterium]|nr:AraC family ligand binding domain-containing protein [Pseudomonadota bacterium]
MGKVLRYRQGEGKAFAWRDDPTTMITRTVDETVSETMGCGYLKMTETKVQSTIDFDEIIVVLAGHYRTRSGDDTYECGPGDTIWIPANTTFTMETDSEAQLFYAKYPAKTATPPTS